jgi:hypothetical protein
MDCSFPTLAGYGFALTGVMRESHSIKTIENVEVIKVTGLLSLFTPRFTANNLLLA